MPRCLVLAALLAVSVAAVLGAVPTFAAVVVVFVTLALMDPRGLLDTDWGLLVTFAAFFVFSGNLARVPAVTNALRSVLSGGALVPAALFSQVMSNVPAAVLLSRFTGDWAGLLVGVNVGGAGTPVASLATLIVIAQFQALRGPLRLDGPGNAPAADPPILAVPRRALRAGLGQTSVPATSCGIRHDGPNGERVIGTSVSATPWHVPYGGPGEMPVVGAQAFAVPHHALRGRLGDASGAGCRPVVRCSFYLLLLVVNGACLAALLILAHLLGW
jgi:hypothetical protein